MPIYQAKRHLLDSTNHLDISLFQYIETGCQKWVQRFGDDLRLVTEDLTGSGYTIQTLSNLKEELLEPKVEPKVIPKKVVRKKVTV